MSKAVWVFLLLVSGLLALWQGGSCAVALWQNQRLTAEVPATKILYEVVPHGSKYRLLAKYVYLYQNQSFTGESFLGGPDHLNRPAAQREIRQMEGMERMVWLDAKKPQFSALEREFPYRSVLYGAITLGVFLYFLFLYFRLQLFQ